MTRTVIESAAAAIAGVTASCLGDVVPQFYSLGRLPGATATDQTEATAVSANGVVVGFGYLGGLATSRGFKWTVAGGFQILPMLANATDARALGVSSDGTVVVGYSSTAAGAVPTIWDATGVNAISLPTGATTGAFMGCSSDGLAAAGYCGTPQGLRAMRWTSIGGSENLGLLTGFGNQSFARAVSRGGTTVIGFNSNTGSGNQAFVWTAGVGMVSLGDIPGGVHNSDAYAISPDGSIIVGDASKAVGGREAFRWTAPTGMVRLGAFPLSTGPTFSYGRGVSADGAIVVGYSTTPDFQEAFRWSAITGLENVQQVLTGTYGLDTTGWLLAYANGVSPDGTTIVGSGIHFSHTEAWVAVLPRPCYANCDSSTTVPVLSVNDFICFQSLFASGSSAANCDGSTSLPLLTVNDFVCFQSAFAAGCP